MLTLRAFDRDSADGARALVALHNRARPYEPLSLASLAREPKGPPAPGPSSNPGRWMIEAQGHILGYARTQQPPARYKPGRFMVDIILREEVDVPEREAAFDAVFEAMEALAPTELVIRCLQSERHRQAILEARGFTIKARFLSGELVLSTFDARAHAGRLARVLASGVRLVSFAEQQAQDPQLIEQLWELEWEIHQDLPGPEATTRISLEAFRASLERPAFLPEGYLLALDGEAAVGVSTLIRSAACETRAAVGLSGTVRTHRRRGIATALKLRGIEVARCLGIEVIETSNEATNPMRRINEALGFVSIPGVLIYARSA